MGSKPRDITGGEALRRLNRLYNELYVATIFNPSEVQEYQEALLHCIAALNSAGEELPLGATSAIIVEFPRERSHPPRWAGDPQAG